MKNFSNFKVPKSGVYWGKNRNSHREYALGSFGILWDPWVCLGILGILWYQEYALVCLVYFGTLCILWYQEFALVFLTRFGIARVYGQLLTGVWTKKSTPPTHHPPPTTSQMIHAVAPYIPQIFDHFLNFLIDILLHLFKLQTNF